MDWQPIINIAITAVSSILLPASAAGGVILAQKMKLNAQKIKNNTWEETKLSVNVAIMAAEQMQKSGKLGASGADKRKYAIESVQRSLARKKIKIDIADLEELIDTQVWDVMNSPIATGVVPVITPVVNNKTPVIPPSEERG